jgi:hypothetical protein
MGWLHCPGSHAGCSAFMLLAEHLLLLAIDHASDPWSNWP